MIFEIIDKTGRKIRLTKEQWKHIQKKHPNLEINDIKIAIKNSIVIYQIDGEIAVYYFYFKHRKEISKYLKIIVKYLNGKGYVITSYFVKNMLK